jgi:hypothetical protein
MDEQIASAAGGLTSTEMPGVIPAEATDSSPASHPAAPVVMAGRAHPAGDKDIREATFNGAEKGPAYAIAKPVDEVSCINGFMIDLDCGILDPAVVGEAASQSADELYEKVARIWLDRDPVLTKAEVRNTGHGLHVLLWMDEPIICTGDDTRRWDKIARGLRNALPGDPNLNGIIAMTRPVGATNSKHEPAKTVTQLRAGQPISCEEILDLNNRVATAPARLWMRVLHGGDRVSPCPLCSSGNTSLGVAGNWQVQCYECGRLDAAALVYRHYSPEFLEKRKDSSNG